MIRQMSAGQDCRQADRDRGAAVGQLLAGRGIPPGLLREEPQPGLLRRRGRAQGREVPQDLREEKSRLTRYHLTSVFASGRPRWFACSLAAVRGDVGVARSRSVRLLRWRSRMVASTLVQAQSQPPAHAGGRAAGHASAGWRHGAVRRPLPTATTVPACRSALGRPALPWRAAAGAADARCRRPASLLPGRSTSPAGSRCSTRAARPPLAEFLSASGGRAPKAVATAASSHRIQRVAFHDTHIPAQRRRPLPFSSPVFAGRNAQAHAGPCPKSPSPAIRWALRI